MLQGIAADVMARSVSDHQQLDCGNSPPVIAGEKHLRHHRAGCHREVLANGVLTLRREEAAIRPIVEAMSVVWSVEKTRWPVSAAERAIRIVSGSRISPTTMMSGAWRKAAR